jgi:hypothetical protein
VGRKKWVGIKPIPTEKIMGRYKTYPYRKNPGQGAPAPEKKGGYKSRLRVLLNHRNA